VIEHPPQCPCQRCEYMRRSEKYIARMFEMREQEEWDIANAQTIRQKIVAETEARVIAEVVKAIRERATYLRDAGHDEATVMTTANVATWLAYGEWRNGRT